MITDVDTPTTDPSAAVPVIQPFGNGFTPFVTLPVFTDLLSPDLPQMQSRLQMRFASDVARGAQAAVVSKEMHPKRSTEKKLYMIRRKQPAEEIRYGRLYLVETARERMFRVVKPENENFICLKTYRVHGSEALVDLNDIRSMWLVCNVVDYVEADDDTEELEF